MAKKKQKIQKNYRVPITVTISSEIPVVASSKSEALKKAEKLWAERYTKEKPTLDVSCVGLDFPTYDVDFAYCEGASGVDEDAGEDESGE